MSKIDKWIDLSELPRKTWAGKKCVDWSNSIGCKCEFKYDDIEGEVKILEYSTSGNKIIIEYLSSILKTTTPTLLNCQFGKLLKKRTNEFKVEIEKTFKDDKRDLTIVDREYRTIKNIEYKYYKYRCNKCNNEDWIREDCLLYQKQGCNVCRVSPRKVILGINTIYDKARWMISLGVSEEDAKKYTPNSNKTIKAICPNCGKKKEVTPNSIYTRKSIGCTCGDGVSYPEKLIMSLLNQLNINYYFQYSPEWIKPKRYDFYFESNNKKYIIETHGSQHYEDNHFNSNLIEEQKNDYYKKEIALKNKIDCYIELDCRKSELMWIKNSILNSELNKTFNLSTIDWVKCEKFALNNCIKEICDYWKFHNEIKNEDLTTGDLGKIFKLHFQTINEYLTKGTKLGWCNYNGKEEQKKIGKKNGMSSAKKIEIFKDEVSLGIFASTSELEHKSKELFGVELKRQSMQLVALGKQKQYKGYGFKYV